MARDIIRTIQAIERLVERSAPYDWIFRGEPACYEKISSGLYREHELERGDGGFDIIAYEKHMVDHAKSFTDKMDDFEVLCDIQHRGGKTNQIDFTKDLGIATYFACGVDADRREESGRVIMLGHQHPAVDDTDLNIRRITNPIHIAASQKSVFVSSDTGYLDERHFPGLHIWTISPEDKPKVRRYLEAVRGIDAKSVFMDISGFIRHQRAYDMAGPWLIKGFRAHLLRSFEEAVQYTTKFFELYEHGNTRLSREQAHHVRGLALYALGRMEEAFQDLREIRNVRKARTQELVYPLSPAIAAELDSWLAEQTAVREQPPVMARDPHATYEANVEVTGKLSAEQLSYTLLSDGGDYAWSKYLPEDWFRPGGGTLQLQGHPTVTWWSFWGQNGQYVFVEVSAPGKANAVVPSKGGSRESARISIVCAKV